MLITRNTNANQIVELANIHAPSDHDVTWAEASQLVRYLIAGYVNEDTDSISTEDLQALTSIAIKVVAKNHLLPTDGEGYIIREPEPGHPELNEDFNR
tara:strand:- start:106 stop:399 length:294 start_codon:yes stop_codon:yes gene_type:complete